jgi:hypothetical protein
MPLHRVIAMPLHRVIKLPSALWLSLDLFLSLFLSLSLSSSSPLSLPACLPPAPKDGVGVGEVESGHFGFKGWVTQLTHGFQGLGHAAHPSHARTDGRRSRWAWIKGVCAHASPCRCFTCVSM